MTNKVVKAIIMTRKVVKGVSMQYKLINLLADFRKEAGLNQVELGAKVGVSRQTISLIERGDYNPSVTVALAIARVLGVDINEIFRLEESYEG